MSGSESERSDGGRTEAVTTSGGAGLPVQFPNDKTTKLSCKLCSKCAGDLSPLASGSEDDQWGGFRPWNKYRKVKMPEGGPGYAYKVPQGRMCMLCYNVYRSLGGGLSVSPNSFSLRRGGPGMWGWIAGLVSGARASLVSKNQHASLGRGEGSGIRSVSRRRVYVQPACEVARVGAATAVHCDYDKHHFQQRRIGAAAESGQRARSAQHALHVEVWCRLHRELTHSGSGFLF